MMKKAIQGAAGACLLFLTGTLPVHAAEHKSLLYPQYHFEDMNRTVWVETTASFSDHPSTSLGDSVLVPRNTKVTQTGESDMGTARVEYQGKTWYASEDLLSDKSPEQRKKEEEEAKKKRQEEEQKKQKEAEAAAAAEQAASWNGPVLTPSAGVVQGPSGRETYYNLDMSGVVSVMRGMGNNDPYWVREDGAKMLGDYVMVAAHLGLRPRGSLIPTSMGMGIVCDTGGFAAANPTQLDIATAW
ncbi:hypothetical protein [uncultured Faecalibaculum sp.]|uniref:hypothetical protein n=1 Tax=uncultured Faecalibaculum sp. TaxID=1729681 RepID=UPI0025E81ED6|nr:hypothetical protein [uncultured Faecalibaculum sp.]